MKKERPILYASHEAEDGFWQFSCGESDHTDDDYKLISLEEVVEIDNSVNDIHNMPLGNSATRETVLHKWEV